MAIRLFEPCGVPGIYLNLRNRIKRIWRLSALRQAVTLTLVLLVMMLVAGLIAIDEIDREFRDRIDAQISARHDALAKDISARGFMRDDYPFTADERVIFLRSGHDIKSGFRNDVDLPKDWGPTRGFSRGNWRYLVKDIDNGTLIVGSNVGRQEEFLEILGGTMAFIGVSAAGIALMFGLVQGWRTQRRLNKLTGALKSLAEGDMSAQTGIVSRRDDLDDLAAQVDESIEKIDVLMRQTREFATNIAHDLKTPLARLRLRLETALVAELEDGDSADQIGAALEQTDAVIGIFDAFLRIAKIESGNAKQNFSNVDLGQLVKEVEEIYSAVVEDSDHTLTVKTASPIVVSGDKVLLIQLLANLIENAMRHTPASSEITLSANRNELILADNGPGIPSSEREKVLRPLYRLEKSRTTDGAGLGLSLVKTIANLHGASLIISDNPEASQPGLMVRVVFPAKE